MFGEMKSKMIYILERKERMKSKITVSRREVILTEEILKDKKLLRTIWDMNGDFLGEHETIEDQQEEDKSELK